MRFHHWRHRDTGPCHPLAVVKCGHGPAFTLYPPGYGPYDRTPSSPISGDGKIVRVGGGGDTGNEVGEPSWMKTVMAAGQDAARGISWSRESPLDDPRRRRTQRRYMEISARLLGLCVALDEGVAQRIAECLGIFYLKLLDLRRAYKTAMRYPEKGAVIVSALALVPVDLMLGERLMEAGIIGGLWRRPKRWDPG